jgi:hypothetical protein
MLGLGLSSRFRNQSAAARLEPPPAGLNIPFALILDSSKVRSDGTNILIQQPVSIGIGMLRKIDHVELVPISNSLG